MKTILLSTLVMAIAAIGGCQSSPVAATPERTIDLAGAQSRYTVQVPGDQAAASKAEPFTLQGWSGESPAMTRPPTSGFQAR